MNAKKIGLGILIGMVITVLAVGIALALPANKGINKAGEASPVIDGAEVKAPPEFVAGLPENKLTKIVFVRYAPGKEPAECGNNVCEPKEKKTCPDDCPKNGGEEPPTSICYGFLSGAKPKWNWVEDYYSDPLLAVPAASAVATWEGAAGRDIFGSEVIGIYEWGVYDNVNSISFGEYADPNVIAVAAIWFRGKNIYEYDIMFDTDFFPEEGTGDYDLPSVALHEFGHAAGLGDLYDVVCINNVMYGYYEGVKTTLGDGDRAGIQKLYGK